MKSSREQFEEWYVKSMLEHVKWYSEDNARNDLAIDTDGSYLRTTVRHKWEGWQASRAAIEIELPDVCAWNLCELLDKKEVVESIRAAGLTVKGDL